MHADDGLTVIDRSVLVDIICEALTRYLGKVEVAGPKASKNAGNPARVSFLRLESAKNSYKFAVASKQVRAGSNHTNYQGNALPSFAAKGANCRCNDDSEEYNDGNRWSAAGFVKYLEMDHNAETISLRLLHAKRFSNILQTGDAKQLLALSGQNRLNAMKALSLLSKYLGCYDRWLDIKNRYRLKWSSSEEDDSRIFQEIYGGKESYSVMLQWLKETIKELKPAYANILLFDALTGLRAEEACSAIHLIHTDLPNYYNASYSTLEHFKYKEIFLRRTKKAYISVITPAILDIAKAAGDYGYNALRLVIKRRGMNMNMNYCRSLYATHLRMKGITTEIIDLVQRRIPKSVFVRHYMRPDIGKELEKVSNAIGSLTEQLQ